MRRAVGRAEPTPRDTFEAHVQALVEGRVGVREISQAHRRLPTFDGEDAFRVVVESGFARIEVSYERSRLTTHLAGDSLLDHEALAHEARAVLRHHGFRRRGVQAHFESDTPHESRADVVKVARGVEALLHGVCGRPRDAFYSVAIERARKPRNNDLIVAIRALAKDRGFEARRVVYQEIVNGTFLLALQPFPDGELRAPVPDVSGPALGGRPCWAAFSDFGALETWRNDPEPFVLCGGYRLVQVAVARRIGALRINPGSKIGGELYANELESIATALGMRV